jgi:hypothetical protein
LRRGWIYLLQNLAQDCVYEGRKVPKTTPPFQTTNPAKDARSSTYGQSRVRMSEGWKIVAITMLIAQRMKSVDN